MSVRRVPCKGAFIVKPEFENELETFLRFLRANKTPDKVIKEEFDLKFHLGLCGPSYTGLEYTNDSTAGYLIDFIKRGGYEIPPNTLLALMERFDVIIADVSEIKKTTDGKYKYLMIHSLESYMYFECAWRELLEILELEHVMLKYLQIGWNLEPAPDNYINTDTEHIVFEAEYYVRVDDDESFFTNFDEYRSYLAEKFSIEVKSFEESEVKIREYEMKQPEDVHICVGHFVRHTD